MAFKIFIGNCYMLNKKSAFTLAEVLVTLAIIGIVAALTIPNLITSMKNQDTVSRFKKVNSVLVQAVLALQADDIDPVTT